MLTKRLTGSQQAQNICITFIQRRPNVFDIGPTLYKCYTNVFSPGAQGSKMSRAGRKGLKVVSNWKFCAESENQRLTCRTWEVFQRRRHCCHGNNLTKN